MFLATLLFQTNSRLVGPNINPLGITAHALYELLGRTLSPNDIVECSIVEIFQEITDAVDCDDGLWNRQLFSVSSCHFHGQIDQSTGQADAQWLGQCTQRDAHWAAQMGVLYWNCDQVLWSQSFADLQEHGWRNNHQGTDNRYVQAFSFCRPKRHL